MYNAVQTRAELVAGIENFEREVKTVYAELVLPGWDQDLRFPQTLYGYMMGLFSRIDLLSAYWNCNNNNQTERMTDFMDRYVSSNREANNVAVQMWRHTLMHTAEPRVLYNEGTRVSYRWLLHWWKHLPIEQHYTLNETSDGKILNIGLVYLTGDVKRATEKYVTEMEQSPSLQANYDAQVNKLASYTFRSR